MGKKSLARVLSDAQAKAIGRNIRTSPRKLNLVAQTIRGKRAEAALNAEEAKKPAAKKTTAKKAAPKRVKETA
jgi:ribosomal protein L22